MMANLGWWAGLIRAREEWRFVSTVPGEVFVILHLVKMMLQWCVAVLVVSAEVVINNIKGTSLI